MTQPLLLGSIGNDTGLPVYPRRPLNNTTQTGIVEVEITGTGTVVIEGQATPNAPWIVIYTFTATGGQVVSVFDAMRARVTANTGTVNAWLME